MVESIDWLVGSGIGGIRGATRIDEEPAALQEELAEILWQYGEGRIETSGQERTIVDADMTFANRWSDRPFPHTPTRCSRNPKIQKSTSQIIYLVHLPIAAPSTLI
jgi:hypothetical protein